MIRGQSLHSGAPSAIRFEAAAGPLVFVQNGREARLDELVVADATRSTTLSTRDGGVRIGTIEHVLAAFAGASVRRDVRVVLEGDEPPLADGGAAAFFDAIARLAVPPSEPELVVVRAGEVRVGESVYSFSPGDSVEVEVSIDFDDARLAPSATWDGTPADFRDRIAVARTFGFAYEVEALAARGLASHVAPESVVVVTDENILHAGRAFLADEPARHKLLDLVGDFFAHGGPPRGRIAAHRPGHRATHDAVARSLNEGIMDRRPRR